MELEDYKKYEPISGKWYLKKKIGVGSYGTVFEIEHEQMGAVYKAALKVITVPASQDEIQRVAQNEDLNNSDEIAAYFREIVEQFSEECKLMNQLKGNTNIVSYEDHEIIEHEGEIGWDILIRMELLNPLDKYLKNVVIDENLVINLGIDICSALILCEKKKIIHRDIKPENIYVTDQGDFKLGDFGVAKIQESTKGNSTSVGTYEYAAPEVFSPNGYYDATCDIYSLGIVLYRYLNDRSLPFLSKGISSVKKKEEARKRRWSGEACPKPINASDELWEVIQRAIDINPENRYASALEMKRALEDVQVGRKAYGEPVIFVDPAPEDMNDLYDEEEHEPTIPTPIVQKEDNSSEELPIISQVEETDFVDEQEQREAEERAQREAEERAQREAEERAQREAEERVQREAEERAQREAEERAQREAEERAQREAEERAQREAEERAQREAEERAQREAEERAQREAEERAQREAEERAEQEQKKAEKEAVKKSRKKKPEPAEVDDDGDIWGSGDSDTSHFDGGSSKKGKGIVIIIAAVIILLIALVIGLVLLLGNNKFSHQPPVSENTVSENIGEENKTDETPENENEEIVVNNEATGNQEDAASDENADSQKNELSSATTSDQESESESNDAGIIPIGRKIYASESDYSNKLAIGKDIFAAVSEAGELYYWGSNSKILNQTISQAQNSGISGIKEVTLNSNSIFVLDNNGALYGWGSNTKGQLGQSNTLSLSEMTKILENVEDVDYSGEVCAAVTHDGSLYVWGFDETGLIGVGKSQIKGINNILTPSEMTLDNVRMVSVENEAGIAVTQNGDAYSWGDSKTLGRADASTNSENPIKFMSNVRYAELGETWYGALITYNDELYTWGMGNNGQLGNGSTTGTAEPQKIMDNVAQISLGKYCAAAITNDGKLYTWGKNDNGQLGNGNNAESNQPEFVMDHVVYVCMGEETAMAICEDGYLYAWGSAPDISLGDGSCMSSSKPVKIIKLVR